MVELDEQNFEHLTQAATGATSGDWLVLFCKPSVARCSKVSDNWQRVATTLAATREAKGLQRINVAAVDTSNAPWLRKRFGIQSVPVVYFFKGGVMYSFHGGGFSVGTRGMCINLRKTEGSGEDSFFAKQQRAQLEKLKATLAKKKRPMDENDEKVRLKSIIERLNVRMEIRDELTTALLLWKHDEDLV